MTEPEFEQPELSYEAHIPPERSTTPPKDDAALIRVLMRVLSERALRASGALLVFALGAWAMWQPTLMRLGVAGGFAVFMLLADALGSWRDH